MLNLFQVNFPASIVAVALLSCLLSYLMIINRCGHAQLMADNDLEGVQKMHHFPVPRVGGIAIYASLVLLWLLASHSSGAEWVSYLGKLLLAALPVFAGGLLEDLTKKISPRVRLSLAFLSALLGILLLQAKIPNLDVFWLDPILANGPILLIFTIFIVGGATHSINIIDGFNGLASGVAMILIAATGILAKQLGDETIFLLSLSMGMAVLGFFLLNFPLGKIFLGDGGAYLLGFWISTTLIMLVNRHPEVSVWFPAALLGYPMFETLFSVYRRRYFDRTRHNEPDNRHIHHLIHLIIGQGPGYGRLSLVVRNSLTSLPIWAAVTLFSYLCLALRDDTRALMWLYLTGILTYKLSYRILKRWTAAGEA